MTLNLAFDFQVDKVNNKITIKREFDATLDLVWEAYTKSDILDQWWAPKPWKARTKSQNFSIGGRWHYAMVGPAGEEHWALAEYTEIEFQKHFKGLDSFADQNAVINTTLPQSVWEVYFQSQGEITLVEYVIQFTDLAQLEATINMGFKEGFTMALENLDHYLSTRFKLRKEYKTSNAARVTTYLNFPGNTEEAFKFYKEVFNGEFTGGGLKRFGDIEIPAEIPMDEATKKLIIHAELTIMGGHVLMATDAPESMGFKMVHGNNMHINIEPGSKEETERLFNVLSEGGTITMPLEMMFYGAYFGSFTDKYGINWMLNFQPIA